LIDRLSRALSMALESPEVQQRMAKLGTDVPAPGQRGSKYADEFVRSEIAKWETVARGARIPKQ
jgi:tripartite-type tricarboxylate transporter receptor subunit TctC